METDPSPSRHVALAVFAGVNALSAWGGAIGLVTGAISLTPELNQRLPFDSPVAGGLALATLVAVPLTVLAWWAATGDARTSVAAQLAGGLLIGWIVIQLAILRAPSFFQPVYVAIGVVLVVWGSRLGPTIDARERA